MTFPIVSADSHITEPLSKLPSEYFRANVYVTFQDDWVAFKTADLMNWNRLMWAKDFPHSDATRPWSQHQADLRSEQRERILCGNAADCFRIDLTELTR